MKKVLIIEDDQVFIKILSKFLVKNGFDVSVQNNIKNALSSFSEKKDDYDIIILDYRLPDGTGLEVLKYVREKQLQAPIIVMTRFSDIRTAVKTIKEGAIDYLTKPINPDELLMIINKALTKSKTPEKPSLDFIKGESEASRSLYNYINLVAPTELTVIIEGESGTGKEHLARMLYQHSKRSHKEFVAVDCGALSKDLAASELFGHIKGAFTGAMNNKKGLFEIASGGTLFLDEIGNLTYEVQIQLLRALQEKEISPVGSTSSSKIDVRVIVATNEDLYNRVKEGVFREDLYHRLNEFKIKVPSLKDRKEDLPLFIDHFRKVAAIELHKDSEGFDEDFLNVIHHYDWPGNLRELKNVIRRSVLLAPNKMIDASVLPDEMKTMRQDEPTYYSQPDTADLKLIQERNERQKIMQILAQVKYNKSKAAALLNIDRTTLYNKLKKYNIE